MVERFTRRADDTGWLSVRLTKTKQLVSLCEFTRVEMLREAEGRAFFKILDGYIAVGSEASLKAENARKYLLARGPGEAATVTVTYRGKPVDDVSRFKGKLRQQFANLAFNGQTATVTLNSVWDGRFTPIPPGMHAILAPDYSHASISTTGYASATPGLVGNDVWFPIGLNGAMQNSSRYIHVGHLSDGCVTVYQLEKWAALYEYLISHRTPRTAGKRIGSLVVKP